MRGNFLYRAFLSLLAAAGLSACAGGVQPGIVGGSGASAQGPYQQGASRQAQSYGNGGQAAPGDAGRVVAINDVSLSGGGGGGSGNGPLLGGLIGGLGGAAIGAGTSHTVVGGLVGGVIGAVGGAIAGTIFDQKGGGTVGGGRGIEVTVQKDDGSKVTVAQRDDGDIQLGDRVQVVQGRSGVAKVVRDNSRAPDAQQNYPPQQNYPSQNYPQSNDPSAQNDPSRGYPTAQNGNPPNQTYQPSQNYPSQNYPSQNYPSQNYPSQNYPGQGYPPSQGPVQPQDDPRYGNLN